MDDEHFIFRIAGVYECEGRFDDIRAFVAHTAAIIDDESDTGRNIFGTEKFDVLRTISFLDVKIGLLQSRHMPASAVCNCYIEHHKIDVHSYRELSPVPVLWNRDGGASDEADEREQC